MKGYKIPAETEKEISAYVNEGIPPNAFVYSILSNRLFEAYTDADDKRRSSISEIVNYLIHEVPFRAWGSEEMVENWVSYKWFHKGL